MPEPAGGASLVAGPLFEPAGGVFGVCGVLGAGGLAFANESLRALRRASTSASSNLTRNDEVRSWMMLSARLYRMPPAPTVSRSDSISMMTPRSQAESSGHVAPRLRKSSTVVTRRPKKPIASHVWPGEA